LAGATGVDILRQPEFPEIHPAKKATAAVRDNTGGFRARPTIDSNAMFPIEIESKTFSLL
jgi:hypothetical protein